MIPGRDEAELLSLRVQTKRLKIFFFCHSEKHFLDAKPSAHYSIYNRSKFGFSATKFEARRFGTP